MCAFLPCHHPWLQSWQAMTCSSGGQRHCSLPHSSGIFLMTFDGLQGRIQQLWPSHVVSGECCPYRCSNPTLAFLKPLSQMLQVELTADLVFKLFKMRQKLYDIKPWLFSSVKSQADFLVTHPQHKQHCVFFQSCSPNSIASFFRQFFWPLYGPSRLALSLVLAQ